MTWDQNIRIKKSLFELLIDIVFNFLLYLNIKYKN